MAADGHRVAEGSRAESQGGFVGDGSLVAEQQLLVSVERVLQLVLCVVELLELSDECVLVDQRHVLVERVVVKRRLGGETSVAQSLVHRVQTLLVLVVSGRVRRAVEQSGLVRVRRQVNGRSRDRLQKF